MSKKNKKKNYNHNMVETNEVKEKKKESKIKKIFCWFVKIPSFVKWVVFILLIIFIIGIGIKYSKTLEHEETVLNFGFKDVGELVTQEWYGRILEDSSKDRKLFNKISIPFTNSRIIFSLDVEVTAGLDFREIKYEEINENTVKIKLPKAKIYKYYQVPNTFKDYLDDESWFTNITSKDRHDLEDAVVEKGKETALESGLLEKADKNAKIIIEQMVKSKNKNYVIEWEYK